MSAILDISQLPVTTPSNPREYAAQWFARRFEPEDMHNHWIDEIMEGYEKMQEGMSSETHWLEIINKCCEGWLRVSEKLAWGKLAPEDQSHVAVQVAPVFSPPSQTRYPEQELDEEVYNVQRHVAEQYQDLQDTHYQARSLPPVPLFSAPAPETAISQYHLPAATTVYASGAPLSPDLAPFDLSSWAGEAPTSPSRFHPADSDVLAPSSGPTGHLPTLPRAEGAASPPSSSSVTVENGDLDAADWDFDIQRQDSYAHEQRSRSDDDVQYHANDNSDDDGSSDSDRSHDGRDRVRRNSSDQVMSDRFTSTIIAQTHSLTQANNDMLRHIVSILPSASRATNNSGRRSAPPQSNNYRYHPYAPAAPATNQVVVRNSRRGGGAFRYPADVTAIFMTRYNEATNDPDWPRDVDGLPRPPVDEVFSELANLTGLEEQQCRKWWTNCVYNQRRKLKQRNTALAPRSSSSSAAYSEETSQPFTLPSPEMPRYRR